MRYLVLILVLMVSCKKEKLESVEGLLEGQWKLYRIIDGNGSRLAPIEEILTIKGRGIIKLEGGEDRLNEKARIISIEEAPLYSVPSTPYYVFSFSVDKRNWFSKTDQLKSYKYLHYLSELDADGNTISTLYLTREPAMGAGDKIYHGFTGR